MQRNNRRVAAQLPGFLLAGVLAQAAYAGFTTVNVTGGPTHPAILEGLYGGSFAPSGALLANGQSTAYSNGSTVVTRMDDDGKASYLYILFSAPGNADDDLWGDGAATILATTRYSETAQEFGFNSGGGYVKMFEVSSGGFASGGMATTIFNNNVVWQWARADDSAGGPVNLHQSDESSNPDGLDHMVTFQVLGAPGVPAHVRVWLLLFEGGADGDFNDLAVELRVGGCTTSTQCDDGLACTFDLCGPKRFCINAPLNTRCQDNNICTTDVCSTLLGCVNNPLDCGDSNACTNDACDPVLGCVHAIDDCDDGIDCTIDECDPIDGCANVPDHMLCNDSNDCTTDSCSPALGCVNANAPWGAACGNQVAQGPCDRPDVCDGIGQCGPYYQPADFPCRTSTGVCDVAELCTGISAQCPPDGFQPANVECRTAEDVCDVAEFCTGSAAVCPDDSLEPSDAVCREAAGECDVTEFCTGLNVSCPPNNFASADIPCADDGDECTLDRCDGSGTCGHPENTDCGACCLLSAECRDRLLPLTCTSQGGTSFGAGSVCMGDSDGDGVDERCDDCPGVDDAVFGIPICSGSGKPCETDADCGVNGVCAPACHGAIPTVSQWGMLILALSLLVAGKVYFGRRPVPVPV